MRPSLCTRARALSLLLLAVGMSPPLAGCNVLQRLGGNDTVDLRRATLHRMTVSLRKPEQTVCPREQVQMAVFMTAIPEGGKEEVTFETWAGRGSVNKNDRLEFSDFTFDSEQGRFDKDGWFAPLEALPATAGHEFVVYATYNPSAAVFSYTYKWKPDYGCITAAGSAGQAGAAGAAGKEGSAGRAGDAGGVMSAGGDGRDGASGGAGTDGSSGAVGPKIRAVVTYVRTPFYDKLVAIRLTGAVTDLLLVHPGRPFSIHANGGLGGPGGAGGQGGVGGVGGAGNPGGHGGAGGAAGPGGRGGSGGAGGTIEMVYDARFPELASAVVLDVAGGKGGAGGPSGSVGNGGGGGKGLAPVNSPSVPVDGAKGREGNDGVAGAVGHPGAAGSAVAHAGAVGDAFSGLADIAVTGSSHR